MTDTPTTPGPKKISTMLTIAAVVTLALAMYLTFTESWPVNYLIDYQASGDGMYSPKLTFAITWLAMLGPCWLVDFIITKMKEKNKAV
jgi:hypothetical protein